jgi:hypothetical protein
MHRDYARRFIVTGLLAAMIAVSPARAQQPPAGAPSDSASAPDPTPAQQADAWVDEALQLRRMGDDLSALGRLNQAMALHPSPRVVAQVAMAEQALGRWADAEKHVLQALASADDPWIQKRRAILEEVLQTIRKRLGSLELTGGPPGASVWIDKREVARLPLSEPIRVTPGSVVVTVTADGYRDLMRTVMIDPGGLARETITMVKEPEPVPTAAPAPATARRAPPAEPEAGARRAPPRRRPGTARPPRQPTDEDRRHALNTGYELSFHGIYQAFYDTSAGLFLPHPRSSATTFSGGFGGHLMLGYRPVPQFSLGLEAAGSIGGGDKSLWEKENSTALFRTLSPGVYLRGHLGGTLLPRYADIWLSIGFSPLTLLRVDAESDSGDLTQEYAVDGFAVPFKLGTSFFVTRAFGIDVFYGTDLWIPLSYCYDYQDENADESADVCFEEVKTELSWMAALGIALLL